MKKTVKKIIVLVVTLIMMASLFVTAYAASRFEWTMEVGDTLSLGLSDTEYKSSNESVVVVEYDGNHKYTAVAVGRGKAEITGGTWMGHKSTEYYITVSGSPFETMFASMGAFFIIFIIALALLLAEIIYILVEAPKCNMSRLWAIVPIFSNILGLIVFIAVRSNRKKQMQKNAPITAYVPNASGGPVTCASCGSVLPAGSTVCYVCGSIIPRQ